MVSKVPETAVSGAADNSKILKKTMKMVWDLLCRVFIFIDIFIHIVQIMQFVLALYCHVREVIVNQRFFDCVRGFLI